MKPQLFILHHAGGNCYSFQFLMPFLTDHFDVIVTELPGRGKRMKEPLTNNHDVAMRDLAGIIKNKLDGRPYITYGHSMGALLTPHILELLKYQGTSPVCAVVSGCASPVMERGMKRHLLTRDELVDDLRRMGGVPEEFLESKDLIDFFAPVVLSDYRVAECPVGPESVPIMDVPVYAIMGTDEKDHEYIADWQKFTTAECRYELMEGKHFFIHNHPKQLAARIKECYDRYMVHQYG